MAAQDDKIDVEARVPDEEPVVSVSGSSHEEMPPSLVKVMKEHGMELKLEKLKKDLLVDQGSGMVAADGCISNPGGPGC